MLGRTLGGAGAFSPWWPISSTPGERSPWRQRRAVAGRSLGAGQQRQLTIALARFPTRAVNRHPACVRFLVSVPVLLAVAAPTACRTVLFRERCAEPSLLASESIICRVDNRSRWSPAQMGDGRCRRMERSGRTRCICASQMRSAAVESWPRTSEPNLSSKTKRAASSAKTVTGKTHDASPANVNVAAI